MNDIYLLRSLYRGIPDLTGAGFVSTMEEDSRGIKRSIRVTKRGNVLLSDTWHYSSNWVIKLKRRESDEK